MTGALIHAGKVRYRLDTDDGRDSVRTTIGQLLQVENVVVLVGSGASMHLGSPSIRAVTAAGLAEMADEVDQPLSEASNTLAQAIIPSEGMDLEDLLGSLAAATAFSGILGSSSVDVRGQAFGSDVVSGLQKELNLVLALSCDLPRGDLEAVVAQSPLEAHRAFFEGLLHSRRAGSSPVRIFTTNYDLVIEKSLDEAGVPFIDGFLGTYERTFNPVMFDVALRLETGARRGQRPDLVYLYKLHGSVNWRSRRVDGRHAILSTAVTAGVRDEGGLALIYPTPQKEGEVLGYPYADLLRALGDNLTQAETALVSVGYGFADAHINRIIARSMESNPALQMLLVEPFGGVLESVEGADGGEASPAAKIARAGDPRVTVVTGEDARFSVLASLLPEPVPTGGSPVAGQDLGSVLSALADALGVDERSSNAQE